MTNATDARIVSDQRAARARASANVVFNEIKDYIPYKCQREAFDKLCVQFYENNVCLIKVDPLWDHLTQQQLTLAHLEAHPFMKQILEKP